MRIVVCAKHVALLGDEIEFVGEGTAIDPDLLDFTLNEWDACATEEALRIREARGDGEIVIVCGGDDDSEQSMRRCLAMGADRGIRVVLESALVDPISVARSLAPVIRNEAPDLVLTGVQSSDAVQGATGAALAALLGLPCVAVVKRLEYDHDRRTAVAWREVEGGTADVVEVRTPAVIAIQTGINEPRYATFRAIKQADQKPIVAVDAAVGGPAAHRVRRLLLPPRGERAEMLAGDAAMVAQCILEMIRERAS